MIFDRAFFGDAGTYTLPLTGSYTLTIGAPDNDTVGPYSFRLWDVPDPDVFDISIAEVVSVGSPGPGAGHIESPGREDIYHFEGTAGQRIFGDQLSGATTGWDWILVAPNGLSVFDRAFFGDAGTYTLPLTGTYTLTIGDPTNQTVGTYSFRILNVPDSDVFDISLGDVVSDGSPLPGAGNIESPGRQDIYHFDATAGQVIFGDLISGGTTGWDWRLVAPNGIVVFDRAFFGDAGTYTLFQTGTYTLTIGDPTNDQVGAYSFALVPQ